MKINEEIKTAYEKGSPVINGNEALFVFEGKAENVFLAGDFNGWEPEDSMKRLEGTDIWYLEKSFPDNARLDYKYVVDSNWINDPLNRYKTTGGFGDNSTFVMPGYRNSFERVMNADVPRGNVNRDLKFYSKHLDKEMSYHVYLPYDYDRNKSYDFIYVLDGKEYLDLTNINMIADYMINRNEMPPSIMIMLDYSERTKEYTIYEPYRDYVMNEIVPFVEESYGAKIGNQVRTVIGASWGGLTAMYLALSYPGRFNRLLSQSGSFWPKDWAIFDMLDKAQAQRIDICIQTGTINDTEEMNDAMYAALVNRGYNVEYHKYAEGHSWGNWQGHLYEGLNALYTEEYKH